MSKKIHRQPEEFVTDLYRGLFRREPDSVGLKEHSAFLSEAKTYGRAASMLHAFVNSPEFLSQKDNFVSSQLRTASRFDSVQSIGSHCITSGSLQRLGLKSFSGPFDWIFSNLNMVADCVKDRFVRFLDPAFHVPIPESAREAPDANFCDHSYYRDHFGVGSVFNHRDITVPEHRQYYKRCVQRFLRSLDNGDETLLVGIVPARLVDNGAIDRLIEAFVRYPRIHIAIFSAYEGSKRRVGFTTAEVFGNKHRLFKLHMLGRLGPVNFTELTDLMNLRAAILSLG